MNDFVALRNFRLGSGAVECDGDGLRVGGVELLRRRASRLWTIREANEVEAALARVYGFPLRLEAKWSGLQAVASALSAGQVARAQIAALLMQWPDPPAQMDDEASRRRLARDLTASGLLKADDDWDARHPRTGTAPNPGWFAPQGGASTTPEHTSESRAAAASWLAEDLSETALRGLARLAARVAVAVDIFDTLFVPSANDLVERGAVPGRPDMTFRWAHDETEVTFQTLVDGEPRTFVTGEQRGDLFYDADGEAIARIVRDESGRRTLVTTLDALDAAEARFRARDGATVPDAASDDFAPKLCPDPSPEPKTTKSENSIRYQEYVSKLPYGSAIKVGGVKFDGCDPATGNLLEAKANIDHLFDGNDNLYWWVEPKGDPTGQMQNQSDVARAAGRSVIWHAQTETGFRGLSRIKSSNNWPNLFVVYDPN